MDDLMIRELDQQLQIREEDGGMVVEGYFALYNDETELKKGVREKISPGAFDTALKQRDILALYGHQRNDLLGRTSSGTLALRSDSKGLFGKLVLPETTLGRDVYALVKRGDLRGCSFGFDKEKKRAEILPGGAVLFELQEVGLREVTITPMPAYPNSSIQARSTEADNVRQAALDARRTQIRQRLEGHKEC